MGAAASPPATDSLRCESPSCGAAGMPVGAGWSPVRDGQPQSPHFGQLPEVKHWATSGRRTQSAVSCSGALSPVAGSHVLGHRASRNSGRGRPGCGRGRRARTRPGSRSWSGRTASCAAQTGSSALYPILTDPSFIQATHPNRQVKEVRTQGSCASPRPGPGSTFL